MQRHPAIGAAIDQLGAAVGEVRGETCLTAKKIGLVLGANKVQRHPAMSAAVHQLGAGVEAMEPGLGFAGRQLLRGSILRR